MLLMKELLWTETARRDLQQIYDYIAEDSVYYADKFVDELFGKVENLKLFVSVGRVVPEIQREDTREIFHHSYRIMYKIDDEVIYVTQITHMAQDFQAHN